MLAVLSPQHGPEGGKVFSGNRSGDKQKKSLDR